MYELIIIIISASISSWITHQIDNGKNPLKTLKDLIIKTSKNI